MSSNRGKNYTEREKRILLSLVDKHKNTIENKTTNASNIMKKNETWSSILNEYNAQAEFPRTVKQLQTAYLNMKRSTRQQVASNHVQKYLERLKSSKSSCDSEKIPEYDEEQIKDFKKDERNDKKGFLATGGGTYTPTLSDVGAQVLAIMGDQVEPLKNKYDSATFYYGVNDIDIETNEIAPLPQDSQAKKLLSSSGDIEMSETAPPPQDNQTNNLVRKTLPPKQIFKKPVRHPLKRDKNSDIKRKIYLQKFSTAVIEKKIKLVEYRTACMKKEIAEGELKIKKAEYAQKMCEDLSV